MNTLDSPVEAPCDKSSEVISLREPVNPIPWPDPSQEEEDTPEFEAIWQAVKTWDINVPEAYGGYCGATGNHVKAILSSLQSR